MAFINDRGDVAVSTANADGVIEGYGAFLAEDGELRALPKEMSSVAGMNEDSQVIGSGRGRAFVWTDSQLVQLPTTGLDPRPSAINDRGDVAGTDGDAQSCGAATPPGVVPILSRRGVQR